MAESKNKRTASSKSTRGRRNPTQAKANAATASPRASRASSKEPVVTHRTSSEPTKTGMPSTSVWGQLGGLTVPLVSNREVWKWIGVVVAALAIVLLGWWQWQRSYVGVINGQYIHTSALADQLVANYGAQTLDTLVQQQLILQDADKKGVTIPADKVQAELDTFKESTGGEDAYQSSLVEYGISEDLLRSQIKVRLTLEEILAERIAVSEEEIEEYYEENQEEVDVADEGLEGARDRIEMQLREQKLSQESSQYLQSLQETSLISRNIDHASLTFGRFVQDEVLTIPADVWNLFASLAPQE